VLASLLASVAFGFAKGFMSKGEPRPFNAQMDFMGPIKEELIYRGAPLWAAPGLPFGATAVTFAVDHIIHDYRQQPMPLREVVARFGDVLLGGLLYERSMRTSGIAGAIASHVGHNLACAFGSRARVGRRLPEAP